MTPQETAQLEAQAYEHQQKTALAAEAKAVLDSWVRYEGQVKARQQKELAETIIAKVTKELENPKVLQQILQQSIADVESTCSLFLHQKNLRHRMTLSRDLHPNDQSSLFANIQSFATEIVSSKAQ